MAMHWDVTKVENYKEKCWIEDKMNPVTVELVEITMAIGMGKITEKNYKEFHTRLEFANLLYKWNTKITEEDVKNHIGLATNVTTVTWNNFIKTITTNWCKDQNFDPTPPKKVKVKG